MDNRTLLKNPFVLSVAASIAVAALLALVWRFTPLAEVATPRDVVQWVRESSGRWWSPALIVLAHVIASFVMFPRPLLTVAAVVAFGAWLGLAYSLAGVLAATAITYYVGRSFDEDRIKRMAGPRLTPMRHMLKKEGLLAVTLVRLLPVAPFTVESIVAGALRVKVWHVLAGTALGMMPGMLGTALLGDQLAALFTEGRKLNTWIIVAAAIGLLALFYFTQRWYRKMEAEYA